MNGPRNQDGLRDLPELKRLARRMYRETFERLEAPSLQAVVKHKITILYGPPMVRPDLFLLSFQGGAGDDSPSNRIWPEKLLYLDDDFRFGGNLRTQFEAAGLTATLERRSVAMAACFPEAPSSEAGRWMAKTGAKAEWREFSVAWVRRIITATRPRAALVFGKKASEAMGIERAWREERRDARGWRGFGRAEIEGCPAVYCQHLSQGWRKDFVQMSLREVRRLLVQR